MLKRFWPFCVWLIEAVAMASLALTLTGAGFTVQSTSGPLGVGAIINTPSAVERTLTMTRTTTMSTTMGHTLVLRTHGHLAAIPS